jgi:hypothetical protein
MTDKATRCDLCDAPATVEKSHGNYCARCVEDMAVPSDHDERMIERRQMGLD